LETDDPIIRSARLSYNAERSGDLFIVPKRYWQTGSAGTTHGTPYKYDQRVPVLLFGAGVKGGRYWGAATPADIAPTLAAICNITMSRPDGRVLSEALATSVGTTAAPDPSVKPTAKPSAKPKTPAAQQTHQAWEERTLVPRSPESARQRLNRRD